MEGKFSSKSNLVISTVKINWADSLGEHVVHPKYRLDTSVTKLQYGHHHESSELMQSAKQWASGTKIF